MRTRQLGKNGPQVPVIGLGAWPLGGGMGVLPEKQVVDTVHAALDHGMTFIDTAEGYRTSESFLGKALAGKRNQVFLATKLSGSQSLEHLSEAVENSLRAMETDYIDLYQLHRFDPEQSLEATIGGLRNLQEQGKIRYIGVSNFTVEQHAEALSFGHVDSSQPMYSMLVRAAGNDVLPYCSEHGIGVIPHSTLAKGLLTGLYKPDHQFAEDDERSWMAGFQGERFSQNLAMADKLKVWAADHGHSLIHLAIAWALANPALTSALVGAKTPKQVAHNAKAADWVLTDDEMAEITAILGDYSVASIHN